MNGRLESALYMGRVHHRRTDPVEHAFSQGLFMVYLDLAELPHVFDRRWLWGVERPAPACFRRADHLGDPAVPLDAAVREEVTRQAGRAPQGPIRLLTHLRYWGYVFNPVSLYYCFDGTGRRVEHLLAEVHNTPWKERYCYVLSREDGAEGRTLRFRSPKRFFVSPFMDMDGTYHWKVTEPGDTLHVSIANEDRRGRFFAASLDMERREIGTASLARALAAHPFMTGRVIAAIYGQAWRLRRKGVPTFSHPDQRAARGDERTACGPGPEGPPR